MGITTVSVSCQANRADGSPISKARFRFVLSETDIEGGLVVPREIVGVSDETGLAVLSLWPNSLGAAGTTYKVLVSDPLGSTTSLGDCTVPNSDCFLSSILDIGAPPTLDQATVAKLAAQQSAANAYSSAQAAHADRLLADADVALTHADVVVTHADASSTHADVVLTHADVVLTHADRTQTGLDRTASDASATAAASSATWAVGSATAAAGSATAAATSAAGASGSATTATTQAGVATTQAGAAAVSSTASAGSATAASGSATSASASAATATAQVALAATQATAAAGSAVTSQSQASLAQGYAASAASVVTQDLSGITAQALHRSPNAVTALYVYDTSKDSDGGAWTEKCQGTSWYNEPLNGKWLGACISATSVAACETIARAISGATTGDYFQASYDGKFYKLNATSGTTETFRGNKAKFPKLVGIVAEAASVTLYDLTEPGRPMFMRFVAGVNTYSPNPVAGVFALNGIIGFAGSTTTNTYLYGGARFINFPSDNAKKYRNFANNAASGVYSRNLAGRNLECTFDASLPAIANESINAIAMTILPDAPLDPVTGLQIPTIAVATNGGVSVIKHDGTVVTKAYSSATCWAVSFDGYNLLVGGVAPDSYNGAWVWNLWDNSVQNYGTYALVKLNNNGGGAKVITQGKTSAAIQGNTTNILRPNKSSSDKSILARIASTYNTGWLLGDLKRAYLADSVVESLSGAELVTNGLKSSRVDTNGWTALSDAVLSVVGGALRVTAASVGATTIRQSFSVTPGVALVLEATVGPGFTASGLNSPQIFCTNAGTTNVFGGYYYQQSGGKFYVIGTPTASSLVISLVGRSNAGNSAIGDYCDFYDIKIRCAVADRSYKVSGAGVYGTLTKALSSPSSSNQIVAYSGFSAANYIQEPYSADLDFGTGEWNVSAWVNIPATLPVASFPIVGGEVVSTWTAIAQPASGTVTISGSDVRINSVDGSLAQAAQTALTVGKIYRVTGTLSIVAGYGSLLIGSSTAIPLTTSGAISVVVVCTGSVDLILKRSAVCDFTVSGLSVKEVGNALIADRNYASGPKISFGVNGGGYLTAVAYDGTTTRTVTTTASYNTATMLKARAVYKTDGSLAIMVNGVQVAVTYGNPLLTLNNGNAVLTIGNSFALDAPCPGAIALLKLSATAPTQEQSTFMYEQEKQLFRDGAHACNKCSTTSAASLAQQSVATRL